MGSYEHLIIGKAEPNDPQRLALHTRLKWSIPNSRPIYPRPPERMRAAREIHLRKYPGLKVRSLDSTYNCMGLVFGSRRTQIDIGHVQKILGDDGYRQIPIEEAEHGDLVLYEDSSNQPCHIGILWQTEVRFATYWVLSQWGDDGEYFHLIDQIPEQFLGGRHTIWTERTNV